MRFGELNRPIVATKLEETQVYLKRVLTAPANEDYAFNVPLGTGDMLVSRIRVELSRIRKRVIKAGKVVQPFKLFAHVVSDVRAQTDCVTFKRVNADAMGKVDLSDLANMLLQKDAQ